MTRGRRSILNYVSATGLTAVTMVVGLISVPFIVRWLGDERYGAFRAAVDWFGYLSLLELGLAGALLPLLARALSRYDNTAVERTVAAGIRAYARVTALMILAALVLVAFITRLIPVGTENAADLTRAALVATFALLLTPFLPFRWITEARQRGYIVNTLLVVQSLVITGLSLILAYHGWGITGQFVALLVGAVIFFGFLSVLELRRMSTLRRPLLRSAASSDEWKQLWHLNRPTLVEQICGRVSFVSDYVVVALILGPAAVAPLYLTRRLADLAQGQLLGVGNASWAALADLHAIGDLTTFGQRLIEATKLVATLAIAVLVPIAIYNQTFVELWVGSPHYAGFAITITVVCNAFLLGLLTLWGWAFGGTGKVATLVPVYIAAASLNLVASIVFTLNLGLVGPLLGTLVATVLTSAWYVPVQLKRTFGISLAGIARAVALPLVWGVPYTLAVWWMAARTPSIGWLALAGEMGFATVVYMGIWWIAILDVSERAVYGGRLRTLMRGSG